MSLEQGTQFTPETPPPRVEITKTERDLNEIIPILAHGLVRRIEQKGFAGKVRVSAMAGEEWGVAKTPDNPTDIPNVIVYPREYLAGDKRVVNARLRHEIGNLNYPIDGELNTLRDWCKTRHIAPELLTVLTEATNEASVNYLEMQNSHSSQPEQNFRALYEQEIDTEKIVSEISEAAPYKQAVDVTLLYTLSQTGLVPKERFEQALSNAHPSVREVFDKQTRSLLDQAVKIAVPKKKVQLVRDYLWPKFSKLVGLPFPSRGVVPSEQEGLDEKTEEQVDQASPEASEQLEGIKEKLEQFAEQMESGEEEKQGGGSDQPDGAPSEGDAGEDESGGSESGQPGGEMGAGAGESGGESGGSMPSAQEMQEFLSQMEGMLNEAKEAGQGGSPGAGQEAIDELLEQVAQMQKDLVSGADPKDVAEQIKKALEKLKEAMKGMGDGGSAGSEQGEGAEGTPGDADGGSESKGQGEGQSHDQFQQGGKSNERSLESMFSAPDHVLLEQLRQAESMVGSKFSALDENGNSIAKTIDPAVLESLKARLGELDESQLRQLGTLEELKRQQQAKIESMYREMSGLDGEALKTYVEYMESMKAFTQDLIEFFVERFKLDKEYIRERHQRRGSRLQRGYLQNIIGSKESKVVISPRSFERKRLPEKPQFAWTLIIDNSGSCSGEIIEQEKKLAVALIEVTKELDIPLEIVTFGGPDEFTFLKSFEQDIEGDDLSKVVLLNADQGTPDVVTLEAACASMERFADKFKRSYNFVYFMTDGQSGSGSIEEVIKKHKKDMVITGVGMAGASQTIAQTWGKNAVEVPDVKKLSDAFIRKIEEQIDSTFD